MVPYIREMPFSSLVATLNHSLSFSRPMSDECFILNDQTFLFYFGLPNSPISAVDEEEVDDDEDGEILIECLPMESKIELKANRRYSSFFSEFPHTSGTNDFSSASANSTIRSSCR